MFARLGPGWRHLSCTILVTAVMATGCSSADHGSDGSPSSKPSDAAKVPDAIVASSDLGDTAAVPKDAARADARSFDTVAEAGPQICPWGDQQVHDTSYGSATTLRICLVSSTASKLRYHISIPSTPTAGGYVVVSFRKVSQYIEIGVGIVPDQTSYALDNSLSASYLGKDFDTWFAAAAGAGFFIDVSNAYGSFATISQDFEMSATLVPVIDLYEPNEWQPGAATITVGTPITASAFAGYASNASPPDLSLSDFYKITLPAGVPTITLTGASPSFSLELGFQYSESQSYTIAAFGETGADGSVSISPSGPVAAGDYYVYVQADYPYRGYGSGTAPPAYLIQSYNLVVTSEPLHDAAPPEPGTDGPKRDTAGQDANQDTPSPDSGWIGVSAGTNYACGVRFDHTVACWGINNVGQGSAPAGSFASVSAGNTHSCGLHTDGIVACWGDNTWGQSSPPDGTFVSVDVGDRESCGVKTDGTAACWGYNSFGQSTPLEGAFASTSSGGDSTCGLRPDGTAACWGYTGYGETSPPGGTFVSLSVGYGHACGVRPDGSLACWGHTGSAAYSPTPATYVAIADGDTHTCGILDSGAVACWGDNDSGDIIAPSGAFTAISAGHFLSCGIRSDRTVVCWGDNKYGQATPPQP
jgi:hypothetical protein